MTSGAWGNQEDATQEVSPRLTQEGGLGSPVPGVKGIPGRRPRLERPRGVKGRGVGGGTEAWCGQARSVVGFGGR